MKAHGDNERLRGDEIVDRPLRERLLEVVPILVPEVRRAYLAWIRAFSQGVLIGVLALGAHRRPRTTMSVDLLFWSEADVPSEVLGFQRTRAHAFEHCETRIDFY